MTAQADSRAEAKRYFRTGMSEIRAGKHTSGIANLKRAYGIKPHPSVLYNIAKAYLAIGKISKALTFFERYQEAGPRDRSKVAKVIRSLRRRQALKSAGPRRKAKAKPKPAARPVAKVTPAPKPTPSEPATTAPTVTAQQYAELTQQLANLSTQMNSLTGSVEEIRKHTQPAAPPSVDPEPGETALPVLEDKSVDVYEQVVV